MWTARTLRPGIGVINIGNIIWHIFNIICEIINLCIFKFNICVFMFNICIFMFNICIFIASIDFLAKFASGSEVVFGEIVPLFKLCV